MYLAKLIRRFRPASNTKSSELSFIAEYILNNSSFFISVIPNDMLFVIADKLQNAEYERLMIEKNGDKKTEEDGE